VDARDVLKEVVTHTIVRTENLSKTMPAHITLAKLLLRKNKTVNKRAAA
jgi:hypothetical protein